MADETEKKPGKVEVVSEVPPPFRGHGRTAKLVAVIGALGAFFAAVLVPPIVAYINRPPPVKANTEEVLKALKEDSVNQAKDLKQTHEDIMELRGWLKGYLVANGVTIRDPDDPRPPPSDPVEVVHPMSKRTNPLARSPEVLTPLPAPRPLTKPKEIPDPIMASPP